MKQQRKRALKKDIAKCFAKSKGRFFSIMSLIALGSFALVGLFVTGPDMRRTGADYFAALNTADVTVIGDLGLDANDEAAIAKVSGADAIEYGYLKDVTIDGTATSVRVFSATPTLSQYEIVEGRMPQTEDEIAVAAFLSDYAVGDTITFDEPENAAGETVLKHHTFTVVGRVHSGEILSSLNQGQSTAGTGALKGYAVVTPEAFDSDVYMLARLSFADTDGVDPYSDEYTALIQAHKDELNTLLADAPALRLETVRGEYQTRIDDGQQELDDARQELADAETGLSDAADELTDARSALDDGYEEVADAKRELNGKVADAQAEIDANAVTLADAMAALQSSEQQLAEAKPTLDEAEQTLNDNEQKLADARAQLDNAAETLAAGEQALADGQTQLAASRAQLDAGWDSLLNQSLAAITNGAVTDWTAAYADRDAAIAAVRAGLDSLTAQLAQAQEALPSIEAGLDEIEGALPTVKSGLDEIDQQLAALRATPETSMTDADAATVAALEQKRAALAQTQAELLQKQTALQTQQAQCEQAVAAEGTVQQAQAGLAQLDEKESAYAAAAATLAQKQTEYEAGRAQYEAGEAAYAESANKLEAGRQTLREKACEYHSGLQQVEDGWRQVNEGQAALDDARQTLASETADAKQKIADAEQELADGEQDYADGQTEYADALAEYNEKKPDADADIADAEQRLADARESLANLETPAYALDTRREIPGAEGYKVYGTVSDIVDSLAKVFPVFLHLVAALVTLTTMTRFVDEERMNSGTLKALGYDDRDIIRKFTLYGWAASFIGAVVGIAAGHTLIPLIVYNAYGHSFTCPPIELHFYLGVTLAALALAFVSAVVPAYLVAVRELRAQPAALLQPKPPAAGSKILLESITPVWNRLSFTHKVTARNIFRYKKRMLMTIFGVCGAVTLLFAGFSVQHSIAGVNDRQFGELLQYDLIVAQNTTVSDDENEAIQTLLASDEVAGHMPVVYKELSVVAGKKSDKQSIKLLVPQNEDEFRRFIRLENRKTGAELALSDSGAVFSERLADLLGVGVGDTVTLTDADNVERTVTVAAVTEMYTGHFLFMSDAYYTQVFGKEYTPNAYLVTLTDRSTENAAARAADFIALDGVAGVVQNTTLITQINTIVKALDKIMDVLILVAMLLAVVILYNLTNINVSERIRELCTIKVLGFYDNEVTLYIYRETILLTALGLLAGYGLGDVLYLYILKVVPPDEVMFNPALGAKAFLVPLAAVALITLVLGFVIHRKLQNVDMLEALKSVD